MPRYLIPLLILSSCLGNSFQADLDVICKGMTEKYNDETVPSIQALKRAKYIQTNLRTEEGKELFNSLGLVDSNQKYELLKSSAHQSGLKDWECSGLKNSREQVSLVVGTMKLALKPGKCIEMDNTAVKNFNELKSHPEVKVEAINMSKSKFCRN